MHTIGQHKLLSLAHEEGDPIKLGAGSGSGLFRHKLSPVGKHIYKSFSKHKSHQKWKWKWMDYLHKGEVLTNTDLDRFVNNIW